MTTRDVDIAEAQRALEYVGPILDQLEETTVSKACRAIADGTLTPADALAAWSRLSGLRETRATIASVIATGNRRVAAQLRAVLHDDARLA